MNAEQSEEPLGLQLLASMEGYISGETEKSQKDLREGGHEELKKINT